MRRRSQFTTVFALAAGLLLGSPALLGLNPHKALTQYSRAEWTQADGLPQDTIRAITQTSDGYLWLGTDEGLTRFDGYDFVTFTKDSGSLPANSITALAAGVDGTLWIGTPNGLTAYRNRRFTTYTTKDGLPDNTVTSLIEDHTGALWITAGVALARFEDGKFTTYPAERLLPLQAVRLVYEDRQHILWVAGPGGLVKLADGKFVPVLGPQELNGDFPTAVLKDRDNGLWIGGSKGLILRKPDGTLRKYGSKDGLPDDLVRALWQDRGGSLWVGTDGGLGRLEDNRFVAWARNDTHHGDWVRSLFEDREGNLWVGMNSGLSRFHDDLFTVYGRTEGWPSDEPNAVHQDRNGGIWIGFHDGALAVLRGGKLRVYKSPDGEEIYAIRDAPNGDLLLSNRQGLGWMHEGRVGNFVLPDSLDRRNVFDTLVDHMGRVWVATPNGVHQKIGDHFRQVVASGPLINGLVVALAEASDGSIWAGTFGEGVWQIQGGKTSRLTTADGMGNDQIRSLYRDPDGSMWIGTFGGGLNSYRDGFFARYTAKDGLLSDNISHIEDDGNGWLWLSTTRGISRISKRQLHDFTEGKIKVLTPINYGVEDGLRSAQCAPGYPTVAGGSRTSDGRLWFPTSRGLAVIDPNERVTEPPAPAPMVQLVEVSADGRDIDFGRAAQMKPGSGHIQFRYTGIHLSAPERVRYEYKLEGLDGDWLPASTRRVADYNSLRYGPYRFQVRASLPGQPYSEASFHFEVLPHFYQTHWFRWLSLATFLAAIYGLYQLRLQQIRSRFSLVLDERARMAREIHDTLAQGFVGISSQLDAVATKMNGNDGVAHQHLALAQKMARHSLTEARRSVMDLRASALEAGTLPSALASAARQWTAGSPLSVEVDVSGMLRKLPEDVEQNVLRIAQEAVNNVVKHASAKRVRIQLRTEERRLSLSVSDDGWGFEPSGAFSTAGGRFGLLGMRERAERLGGQLDLSSEPGRGTQVEVSVPLPSENKTEGARRRFWRLLRTPPAVRS
jgi:signal transduction histidine kinase/ligand-binding sensor domain-containing protein